MLTLTGGVIVGSFIPLSVKAQKQESAPWYISDVELKTKIVLPATKKAKKLIETNRFGGQFSQYEKIIKIAESVYPASLSDSAPENEKSLRYLEIENKKIYNLTARTVNYYFGLTPTVKDASCKYSVEVNQFRAISKDKAEETNQVTLSLSYGYICGFLCCYGITLRKKVIFNQKDEIVSLHLPTSLEEIEC